MPLIMVTVASACFAQRLRLGAGAGAATALATLEANAAETPAAVARSMNSRRLMNPWRKSTMASSRNRLRSAMVGLRSPIAGKLLPERACAPLLGRAQYPNQPPDRTRDSDPCQVASSQWAACGAIHGWVVPLTMHSRWESMI